MHSSNECKGDRMKTLTLRGIDDTLADALKKASKESNTSINKTAIRLLREALGLDKKKYRTYHDLDHLAGTWTLKEYEQFQESIKDFETIDEELWK